MKIIESYLRSKKAITQDHGGEDRFVVTEHYAAVIDGATAKTSKTYNNGRTGPISPGMMAANILAQGVEKLDPKMTAENAIRFLNDEIYNVYCKLGLVKSMKENPQERFMASMVLFNPNPIYHYPYLILAGDCQAIVDGKHHQQWKLVDALNADARSEELHRLITSNQLTEKELLTMTVDQDPGRRIILDPPENSLFPGLKGQSLYQNNPQHELGYFVLDGFADYTTPGFQIIELEKRPQQIVLATDGYLTPEGEKPVQSLSTLASAEAGLKKILDNDPCCYKLYKGTKGKGDNQSFDDRAYLRLAL